MIYTVVLTREEDGRYSVSVPALPGCLTWGETPDEALLMAEDAIQGYLEVLEEDGKPIPPDAPDVQVSTRESPQVIVCRLPVRLEAQVA
jgi:predicted RNase H-like HicB family nuclease